MAHKKKKPKKVKVRNPFALHSTKRKAGPMKDKRKKRQNGTNKQREYMDEE